MLRLFILFAGMFFYHAVDAVGPIQVKAINSRSNVLYAGIDNQLQVQGVPTSGAISLTTNNGTIIKTKEHFYIIPARRGRATINVMSGGDLLKEEYLEVKVFPQPKLMVNGVVLGYDESIPKAMLIHSDSIGLGVHFTDDIVGIESWYSLVSFTLGYVYGNHYMSERVSGHRLNERCKELVSRVPPNSELVIRMVVESNDIITETRPIFRVSVY